MCETVASSVLVRIHGPDSRRNRGISAGYKIHEGANTFLACSGVVFCVPERPASRFVVCNGGTIAPFIKRNESFNYIQVEPS